MVKTMLAFLVAGFMLAANLQADTFELKPKKITVTKKNAQVLPELELRPTIPSGISKEPKYRSDHPQRFQAHFGDGEGIEVAFAVDEKRGSGKGYDFLYVDVTGEGDLSKGKKVSGKSETRGYSFLDTAFSAFEIQIPGEDASEAYPVQARFSIQRNVTSDSTLYLTPLQYLEGSVVIGEEKLKIMVFDANCNGVFGEKGSPGGSKARGDRLWIGSGSPKMEDAYVESLPLGQYYLQGDAYYEIAFDGSSQVKIQKADVALGKIKVNNPGFLLELVQGNSVLYVSNDKGQEAIVPTGSYRINTAGFRTRYKGKIWELEGTPGTCREQFNVREDEVTAVSVGPPLKIMVSTTLQTVGSGQQASFRFSIAGSGGEGYQYLRMDGKKVDLPEISIRNDKGKEVQKGQFEYG